ncbi:MAG: hypothetical protein IKG21_02995 [Atopobiaceae bacterium]|nr:hypothetical protein [Atopobiaceae bacterium]
MITRKEFLATAYGLLATSALAACASNPTIEPQGWTEEERAKGRPEKKKGSTEETDEKAEIEVAGTVVKVAVAGTPYVEILTKFAHNQFAKEEATLQILETDSVDKANQAVVSGNANVSFCQRGDELDAYNREKQTQLASAASIMYWPLGIYSSKHDSLKNITEGMSFAIPNSGSQRGRALILLHQEGIIGLRDPNALEATTDDVVDNPNQIEFREMDAGALAGALEEEDYVVLDASSKVTGEEKSEAEDTEGAEDAEKASAESANKSANAGTTLHVSSAIAVEASDGSAARAFGGVIATTADAVEDARVAALVQVFKTKEFEAYLQGMYGQDVLPVA